MKRRAPHLLRVEQPPPVFAPLVAAARERGLRTGWLELERALEPPPELEDAAAAGMLRAVAVGASGNLGFKARTGPPVLVDLLREHFAGCALVLVRGPIEAPSLSPASGDWQLTSRGKEGRRLSTIELAERLRRRQLL